MSIQKKRGSNLENRSLYHHLTLSEYLKESQEFENLSLSIHINNSKN